MFDMNNREAALLIWLAIFLAWALSKDYMRDSLAGVLRAFLARPIVFALIAMISYISVCVILLNVFGMWQWHNLKTTIVWGVTFAAVTMFDIGRITEHNIFFKKTVRDAIGATALVAFIAELYSFSLPAELILLPFMAFTGAMHAYSQIKTEYADVEKILGWILSLIGLIFIGYGFYQAIQNIDQIATAKTVMDFVIPILLTFLFLPFIYVFSLYVAYEQANINMSVFLEDHKLRSYAIGLAFFSFRGNLDALQRWSRKIASDKIADRNEARKSIGYIQKLIERENNPPVVKTSDGWSPYSAKDFLRDEGIKVRDYHEGFENEWYASSEYLEIDNGIFPDRIAYHIEGDEIVANKLKLVLDVNNPDNYQVSENKFRELGQKLLSLALCEKFEKKKIQQILSNGSVSKIVDNKKIELTREDWAGGAIHGFTIRLVISHVSVNKKAPRKRCAEPGVDDKTSPIR